MAFALVGSLGALATATGSLSPSFGQTTTAGNLLICWTASDTTTGAPTCPSPWLAAKTAALSPAGGAAVWWRIAAGNDSAPLVSGTNHVYAQLGEFSGNATSSPPDQTGVTNGVTSGITTLTTGPDTGPNELVCYAGNAIYSRSATVTLSVALNNGATSNDTTNNSTSTTEHMVFGWGITTGNSSADTATLTCTTTHLSGDLLLFSSFLQAVAAVVAYPQNTVMQAVNRVAVF